MYDRRNADYTEVDADDVIDDADDGTDFSSILKIWKTLF